MKRSIRKKGNLFSQNRKHMVTYKVLVQQHEIFKLGSTDKESYVKDENYRVISRLQMSSTFIRVKFQVFKPSST